MDEGTVYGRGIGFPPRLGPDGRWMWSEGAQNVRESIRIILLTEAEERLMLPEFGGGLHSFLFEPNTIATHRLIQEYITQALGLWEPRIALDSVSVGFADDEDAAIATIAYRLIATGTSDQLSMSIQLAG